MSNLPRNGPGSPAWCSNSTRFGGGGGVSDCAARAGRDVRHNMPDRATRTALSFPRDIGPAMRTNNPCNALMKHLTRTAMRKGRWPRLREERSAKSQIIVLDDASERCLSREKILEFECHSSSAFDGTVTILLRQIRPEAAM